MNTDRVQAPVMGNRTLERQKESLLAYIQEHSILPPDTRFRYITHQFTSKSGEPTMVEVYLDLGGNEATFEIPLEELKLFQGNRFPLPNDVTQPASKTPPIPTSRQPVNTAPQVDWVNNRESLFARVASLEPEARRYVSAQVIDGRRQMTCRCIASKEHLCDHLQFVYATSWERDKLLDESGSVSTRPIRLPIGMGEIYVDLDAVILEDATRPVGKLRTGYVRIGGVQNTADQLLPKLANEISPFPREIDHVILAPGEGTIKAIRYIESLLRGTEQYQQLCALSPLPSGSSGLIGQADTICSRRHTGESGRRLVIQFIAGLRAGNEHRENWMVACAYTIFMTGLCLPCYRATNSSANVPVF